jgi:signal transduction histidine kinase
LIAAGAWSLVALLATGFVLSSLYRARVETAFDDRLDVYVKGLIAELEFADDGTLRVARDLPEPRFNFPLSGWYWQIESEAPAAGATLVSPSLLDRRLDIPPLGQIGDTVTFYTTGPDQETLRVISRQISFSARQAPLVFLVAGDATEIGAAARSFDGALAMALSLLGIGLVTAALLQVHYGLGPLRDLRAALQRIRAGADTRLTGAYPREIAPLSDEVNALIEANEEVLERARTHVGNLAHALKTPLSVLTNEAAPMGDDRLAEKVREQVAVMREQVDRHLERARVAARGNVIGVATDVGPVVAAIVRTLQKIHGERAITVTVACEEGVRFRGERQDLEEMIGNLLDNAFKWADREIGVRVARAPGRAAGEALAVTIDDDGPGLNEAQRADAVKRGRRLDESKPGSGLGLSIVADIASMYRGAFALERAALGGLSARLVLPALAPA